MLVHTVACAVLWSPTLSNFAHGVLRISRQLGSHAISTLRTRMRTVALAMPMKASAWLCNIAIVGRVEYEYSVFDGRTLNPRLFAQEVVQDLLSILLQVLRKRCREFL
ncbi:hypothetical protein HBH56_168160 [Parastagonospora nodorum]|uniref:Uncharacterized protein n=1 Tax=Phaeosphaeria nodorum (strain SN15 / ATCC MYA-4574 / FGSC 10173) TaxID=321614 RepID=A0A7U2F4Q1_PHANO|nr:hypothetical protein HBH56_168160 [Parastagonospora nodorum]QRC98679.1 hypothetical protein JI435_303320 [Parastagonospora nodorum SN15]KAH3936320.1 hypothetical protein HBH54_031250 [Parastagonospora nodorum]KAH3948439.1 hypothetical protein HBH53_106020 [Parastagonospora nodorum]KAH4144597.1 hypothetical protein HBH45_021740 [Parastagonospora nodorum]